MVRNGEGISIDGSPLTFIAVLLTLLNFERKHRHILHCAIVISIIHTVNDSGGLV